MKFRRPRNYEEQTHENPWWLIRYPHQKRFATAATLLLADQPGVVMDYGAGNGEVLAQVLADPRGASIDLAIAYDPDPQMRASAEKKLVPHSPRAAVIGDLAELESALQGRRVDAVACLEVLEHLSLTERQRFYSVCSDNLVDGGLCLIDVPVEIGPTLLVKVIGRRVLKGRPREYRLGELLRPTFGMRVRDPERFDPERQNGWVQDHKGFDYRELCDELREWLPIERTISTPVRALPPWLCNQEIFLVARQPSAPRPRDRQRSAGIGRRRRARPRSSRTTQ
ncbi:MAG: methyltransferase [Solirubrobacterales bacterium]